MVAGPVLVALLVLNEAQAADRGKSRVWHDGGFAVEFPAPPEERVETTQTSRGAVAVRIAIATYRDTTFAAYRQEAVMLPEAALQPYYDRLRTGHVEGKRGALLGERSIMMAGRPARESTIVSPRAAESPATVHRVCFVLADGWLYELMAVTPRDRVEAANPDVDAFFRSFQPVPAAESKLGTGGVYRSQAGGFTVWLPAQAAESRRRIDTEDGPSELVSVEAESALLSALVMYKDVGAKRARDGTELFDAERDFALEKLKAKLVSERRISLGRNPGREFQAVISADDERRLRGKVYVVGHRVYTLLALFPDSQISATKSDEFFKSFRLIARH
jgi:hypothetical protein